MLKVNSFQEEHNEPIIGLVNDSLMVSPVFSFHCVTLQLLMLAFEKRTGR